VPYFGYIYFWLWFCPMKKSSIFHIILLSLSLINTTIAGTIDPKSKDEDHISYGAKYNSVVVLCSLKNEQLYKASAVIIKPQWILTAAHAVYDHHDHHIIYNDEKTFIDKIILPTDFNIKKFGYKDLALGRLSKQVVIDICPELYSKTDEIGQITSIVGYGDTGTFSTGSTIRDNLKRGGTNTIDYIENDLLVCSVLNIPHTPMEFLIASGDSGGGLFIDNKLAGINSGIWNNNNTTKPKSTYSTQSGHTRISQFKNWIIESIEKSSTK
jgi:hypothetical protein